MLLFTPGPTPVPESVRQAMATPTLHHRTPEFEAIFKEARERLMKLYGMDECVMLASSGTGAMQACVLNLCKKKALTINAGKFGERFGKIVKAMGKELVELKYEWNTPASLDDVKKALEANADIDSLFIQVSESAGGLRHPVEEIAAYVKSVNANIMVIADGITAVGVEKIDISNIEHTHQHDQRSGESIDEELDRRIKTFLSSPCTDDIEHRHQGEFPEKVENDRIQRDEDTDHGHFKKEQRNDHIFQVFDVLPERDDPQKSHQGRHHDDKETDPVDSQIVVDPEIADQRNELDELEAPIGRIKSEPEPECQEKLDCCHSDAVDTDRVFFDHESQHRRHQREKDQYA